MCCTQTGSGWSHLGIAAHLCSWDSERSVSLCMLYQAPHRDMASRKCERLHPLDAPHSGCLWMDQVTLCVMIWGKPALVPSESPYLLALCLNVQPLVLLPWVKAVVPQPFPLSLDKESFFNIRTFNRSPLQQLYFQILITEKRCKRGGKKTTKISVVLVYRYIFNKFQ